MNGCVFFFFVLVVYLLSFVLSWLARCALLLDYWVILLFGSVRFGPVLFCFGVVGVGRGAQREGVGFFRAFAPPPTFLSPCSFLLILCIVALVRRQVGLLVA